MHDIEVDEQRLTPEQADYLQRWIDEYCKQQTSETLDDPYADLPDSPFGLFRVLLYCAAFLGLSIWGLVAWLSL